MPSTGELPSSGRFDWKRRMGVHEAYHQSLANRWLHWSCIPLELLAIVKLASLASLGGHLDLALVVIAIVAPIYLLTEPVIGTTMVGFLVGCWWLADHGPRFGTGWDVLVAVALFSATFAVQVAIGHGSFEGGRDDTNQNLAEFRTSRNPIPLLLVFYYHLVEIFFALGYRPRLERDVAVFTAREIASGRLSGGIARQPPP